MMVGLSLSIVVASEFTCGSAMLMFQRAVKLTLIRMVVQPVAKVIKTFDPNQEAGQHQ